MDTENTRLNSDEASGSESLGFELLYFLKGPNRPFIGNTVPVLV